MEKTKDSEQAKPATPMAFPLYGLIPGRMNPLTNQQEMTALIQGGMELRDWFAGQFVAAVYPDLIKGEFGSDPKQLPEIFNQACLSAYEFADCLIKVREKNRPEFNAGVRPAASMTSDKG